MAEFKFRSDGRVSTLQNWLMQLLGNEFYPNLQIDVGDIEYLLSLKSQNEKSEKNVAEEIKLKKARIDSINTKVKVLKSLVKSENISLGNDAWKQADCIARLAAKMNIEELDLTNFLLAICNMKNEKFKNEEQGMLNCALLSSYSQQSLKIRKSNDVLQSQLDAVKKVVDTQQSNKVNIAEKIKFFNTKSTEYKHNVKFHQESLKAINFEESLQHYSLIESSKANKGLEEKLKASKDKLKYYRSLPPNESLTRLKIEEKKEELKQLEEEFRCLLNNWENSVK